VVEFITAGLSQSTAAKSVVIQHFKAAEFITTAVELPSTEVKSTATLPVMVAELETQKA